MSGTEPARSVTALHPLVQTAAPQPGLVSAIQALYRACHRRPPAVLVARSADDFVRMLALLTFRPKVILARMAFALGFPCLMLAILGTAWAVKDPSKLAETGTGLILDIYIAVTVLGAPVLASRMPPRMAVGSDVVVVLLAYATGAACGAIASWLLGGNEFHVLFGAVAGTAAAVLAHYAGLLLWATWSRWRGWAGERRRGYRSSATVSYTT